MTSATKDRRLVKGLAALLGTPMDDDGNPLPEGSSNVQSLELNVNEIENNPFQPRREFNTDEIASLAESIKNHQHCLLYTSPSPRDATLSRMPSSA